MTGVLIFGSFVLIGALVEGFRRIQGVAPRYVCAIRVAESVLAAWDEPAIAERRKALEARALADQRALERAVLDIAQQKEAERQ